MIQTTIQEVNVLGNTINVVASNILNYDLGNDDCRMRYELRFRDPNRESVAIPDTIVTSGEWKVPENVTNAWSGSNHYLAEELCNHLGFTVISHSNY
jgi:hypothetical protein